LNGIARSARDLNSYLWVADPRQVTFLWTDKEKLPKEIRPGAADILLRVSGKSALA
jgi:hypothetical protein